MATQIFISYRREGGDGLARSIYERLDKDGYKCFFDNETLGSGRFDTALYKQIDECTDFLLILPPSGLDRCQNADDWVRLEIERAVEKKKNIIPIMMPDFEFPPEENLPKSMKEIPKLQSLRWSMELFSECIQKLETPKYLNSKPIKNLESDEISESKTDSNNISAFIKVIPIVIICIIASFFLPKTQSSNKLAISAEITIGSEDEVSIEDRLKVSPVEQITLGAHEDTSGDTPEKFEDYLKKAEKGDSDAMLNVAACYYKGEGVAQDLNKGFKWYLKSAESDNPIGMWMVAVLYSSGVGTEKDNDNANKWFTKSYERIMKEPDIDLEDRGDMWGLGFFYLVKYLSGIDKEESAENAFKWFKKSADAGYDEGKLDLGCCYIDGIGTDPNYEKAFELFSEVAKDYLEFPVYRITLESTGEETLEIPNNNPSKDVAKLLIGSCYAEGKGVPQDYQKAFEYFMEAAEAGVTEAMANVGAYYWQGKGVAQDYDQAFYWCLKAAEAGNVTAMNTVGKIYYLDKGTHKDYERAFFWFEKAANAFNVDAMKNLSIMYKNGEGVPKDEKKSREWQQKYEKFQKAFKPIKM